MSVLSRIGSPYILPSADKSARSNTGYHTSSFYTAKVVEFFSDPKNLSEAQTDLIKKSVEVGALVDRMPINSIWCQVIGAGRLDQHIAYPFFPPHLCLPIKPAEEVWIFFDGQMHYWVCRKTGDYISDDTNYTHIGRIVNPNSSSPSAKDKFNNTDQNPVNFPEGNTNSIYNKTLGFFNSDENIINSSVEYNTKFKVEPVPRIVRSPGDLVIQGSNNASIRLGNTANQAEKGIVDIVAGHSLKTVPVTNTRNDQEVDKTKKASDDGAVDFKNDLSRLYLTINENVDLDLGVQIEGIDGSGSSAYAALKSTKVRLVARGDVKITSQSTGASIVIKDDGNIVIVPGSDGKVLIAGTNSDQPYLRYDEFSTIINDLVDIIDNLQTAQASVANAVIAAIPASAAAINTTNITASAKITSDKLEISQKLQSIRSQKILGS